MKDTKNEFLWVFMLFTFGDVQNVLSNVVYYHGSCITSEKESAVAICLRIHSGISRSCVTYLATYALMC